MYTVPTYADTPPSKKVLTASGSLRGGGGYYYGYIVTTALSAAAITLYDNTDASGSVVDVIPASTGVGTHILPNPVPFDTGLYASFAGTGTVEFLFA